MAGQQHTDEVDAARCTRVECWSHTVHRNELRLQTLDAVVVVGMINQARANRKCH